MRPFRIIAISLLLIILCYAAVVTLCVGIVVPQFSVEIEQGAVFVQQYTMDEQRLMVATIAAQIVSLGMKLPGKGTATIITP